MKNAIQELRQRVSRRKVYLAGKCYSPSEAGITLDWRDYFMVEDHAEGRCAHSNIRWPEERMKSGHVRVGPYVEHSHGFGVTGDQCHGLGGSIDDGNVRNSYFYGDQRGSTRRSFEDLVLNKCIAAITQADIVFCWLDAGDAFGTLFELGVAFEMRKRVVIAVDKALSPDLVRELWFPLRAADAVVFSDNPVEGFQRAVGVYVEPR